MTTSPSATHFPVFGQGDLVLVRIVGPGICRESGRFENILRDVEGRHPHFLVLDLSDCPRVDSTFAGAFLRLADRVSARPGVRVALTGLHGPVEELVETLCLGDIFPSLPLPALDDLQPIPVEDRELPRNEILALSLEGHERLASLNEENARRFATLLGVLREQIRAST